MYFAVLQLLLLLLLLQQLIIIKLLTLPENFHPLSFYFRIKLSFKVGFIFFMLKSIEREKNPFSNRKSKFDALQNIQMIFGTKFIHYILIFKSRSKYYSWFTIFIESKLCKFMIFFGGLQ